MFGGEHFVGVTVVRSTGAIFLRDAAEADGKFAGKKRAMGRKESL
jgi:hypothetical protein